MTSLVDRVDHLVTQYIWVLENDSEHVCALKVQINEGYFKNFSGRLKIYIEPIQKLIGNNNEPDKLSEWELSYLFIETWCRLGGYGKALTTKHGNLSWHRHMQTLINLGFQYTDRGLRHTGTSTTNPCAEIQISKPQPCTLAIEPKKEIPVSKKIIIANVTFINNVDVTTMNDAQLIDAIKTIEAEITDLKAVKAKSAKIAAKVLEAQDTLAKVVEILDSRP